MLYFNNQRYKLIKIRTISKTVAFFNMAHNVIVFYPSFMQITTMKYILIIIY